MFRKLSKEEIEEIEKYTGETEDFTDTEPPGRRGPREALSDPTRVPVNHVTDGGDELEWEGRPPEPESDSALETRVGGLPRLTKSSSAPLEARRRALVEESRARLRAHMEDAKDGAAQNAERHVLMIPLSRIRTDFVRNIRIADDEEELRALAESMRMHGLIEPVMVVEDSRSPDRYQLICGSRRLAAAHAIGWQALPATVLPPTTPEIATFLNAVENLQRRQISPYEVAVHATETCSRLGISLPAYAKRVGLRPGTVMKYAWLLENLPVEVSEAWRQGHPVATIGRLEKLASRREDASELWAREVAKHAIGEAALLKLDDGDDEPRESRAQDPRPPLSDLRRRRLEVRHDSTVPEPLKKLALQLLDYELGDADEVEILGWIRNRRRRKQIHTNKKKANDTPDLELPWPPRDS